MEAEIRARLVQETGLPVAWGLSIQFEGLPRVTLYRVSGVHDSTTAGPSGLVMVRVQANCYGDTYAEALATAEGVQAALSGWSAGQIEAVLLEASRDTQPGDADIVFTRSLDFIVHYQET